MKPKKPPLRQCIACRQMKDKRELIRIVRSQDGEISLDFDKKKNGRGAYVCPSEGCVTRVIKSKLVHKAFRCEIGQQVYDRILEEFHAATKQD